MPSVWNHFDFSAESFGREDFFTASLASLMIGVPQARAAFLEWIDVHAKEELPERTWRINAQVDRPTKNLGGCVLDMVLACDGLELWFEHKLGAKQGVTLAADGTPVTQLAKYQQARIEYEETKDFKTRVLLFYITPEPQKLDRQQLGQLHEEGGRGFVWVGPRGGLRWEDLYPRMLHALTARQAKHEDFPTMLFAEFMEWWGSMADMRPWPTSPDLHPTDPSERRGLWRRARDSLEKMLPGDYHHYKGANIEGRPHGSPVEYLLVEPREPRRVSGWHGCPHVLQVAFRGPTLPLGDPRWHRCEGGWSMMVHFKPSERGNWVRVFVALEEWEHQTTDDARQVYIENAVVAAAAAFQEATSLVLSGGP